MKLEVKLKVLFATCTACMQRVCTVDFSCVQIFRVACTGNVWFVWPIDCDIEHHIFQSINFLYTEHGTFKHTGLTLPLRQILLRIFSVTQCGSGHIVVLSAHLVRTLYALHAYTIIIAGCMNRLKSTVSLCI